MTTTTNLGLTLPTVGADSGSWGTTLNGDLTQLDALWSTLGNNAFGTAASQNTGTSGATVPLLNGTNTWGGAQTFSLAPTLSAGMLSQGDITVERSGGPTTGYIFYGN